MEFEEGINRLLHLGEFELSAGLLLLTLFACPKLKLLEQQEPPLDYWLLQPQLIKFTSLMLV